MSRQRSSTTLRSECWRGARRPCMFRPSQNLSGLDFLTCMQRDKSGATDLTCVSARATLGAMTDIELARQALQRDALAFALVKDGAVLRTGVRDGIGELLEAVDALGEAVRGASLADKIVGKAVAMVARAAGLVSVYATLASQAARDALAQEQIPLECERLVPLILNKRSDGPCPMERLTLPLADPHQAVAALREFVRTRPRAP